MGSVKLLHSFHKGRSLKCPIDLLYMYAVNTSFRPKITPSIRAGLDFYNLPYDTRGFFLDILFFVSIFNLESIVFLPWWWW